MLKNRNENGKTTKHPLFLPPPVGDSYTEIDTAFIPCNCASLIRGPVSSSPRLSCCPASFAFCFQNSGNIILPHYRKVNFNWICNLKSLIFFLSLNTQKQLPDKYFIRKSFWKRVLGCFMESQSGRGQCLELGTWSFRMNMKVSQSQRRVE